MTPKGACEMGSISGYLEYMWQSGPVLSCMVKLPIDDGVTGLIPDKMAACPTLITDLITCNRIFCEGVYTDSVYTPPKITLNFHTKFFRGSDCDYFWFEPFCSLCFCDDV